MQEGLALFKAGSIRESFARFERAAELVPLRSRVGGSATLQKALALDSMGYNDQAKQVYKTLLNHPSAGVGRRARQMLAGFDAAAFLKADTISFSGNKREEYAKYFRKIADRNRLYIATEQEKERDKASARMSMAIALATILGPILFILLPLVYNAVMA